MRTHSEKPYSYEVCDKLFSTTENKDFHMRKHTSEKPYSCDICMW